MQIVLITPLLLALVVFAWRPQPARRAVRAVARRR